MITILIISYERLTKLKKLRWEFGSILPNDIRNNLSPSELNWFSNYCRNLSDYMNIAEKVKEFFHNEGIHSTTIQPEFVDLGNEVI